MKRFLEQAYATLVSPNLDINALLEELENKFVENNFRNEYSKNILIVRLDSIGDLVLTTSFIRELKRHFLDYKITFVCTNVIYNLLEKCPYIDELLVFNPYRDSLPSILMQTLQFCSFKLWNKKFDIAYSPQFGDNNQISLFFTYLSGAKKRIGYGYYPWITYLSEEEQLPFLNQNSVDSFLLTDRVFIPNNIVHESEKNLYLLERENINISSKNLEVWIDSKDRTTIIPYLTDKVKIVINISAGKSNCKYSYYKKLIERIYSEELQIILIGGDDDKDYINDNDVICNKITNLIGKLTLRETAALIEKSDIYIGNDTGVIHIAAALNKRIILLSREANDSITIHKEIFSSIERLKPFYGDYENKAIIIRPKFALNDCINSNVHGGCRQNFPHCITNIDLEEIISAFNQLKASLFS